MPVPEIRKKVIREEIDINAQENFFSKLIKGLMSISPRNARSRD